MAPSDDLTDVELSSYYAEIDIVDYDDNVKRMPANTPLNGVTKLYCIIDYPVSNIACVGYDTSDLTLGKVLYLYTQAYQHMYKCEDDDVGAVTENISGMFNRQKSSGRFGIWGHHIGDLVYNGFSSIKVYGDIAVAHFSCDS